MRSNASRRKILMVRLLFIGGIAVASGSALAVAEQGPDIGAQLSSNGQFIAEHYPPGALKRGEQGKVKFQLTIEKDGSPVRCEVTKSSGFATLDQETCEMLVRYAFVKPAVDRNGKQVRATKIGYIAWTLPSQRTARAAPTGTALPEPLICKRTTAPGSLVVKVRRCMSTSEWKLDEAMVRDQNSDLQGRNYCGDHGC